MRQQNSKILILGGSSYLGKHLLARLGKDRCVATYCKTPFEGGVYFDALSMSLDDIVDDASHFSHAVILLGDTKPASCLADPKKSHELNVEAIKRIIDQLKQWNIKSLFTSSEHIYDGQKGDYNEADEPHPILLYGRQKLEVEEYMKRESGNFIILRIAKMLGEDPQDGTLFSRWLSDIEAQDSIRCAEDQIFSPLYIGDAVEAIVRLIDKDISGTFNVSSGQYFRRIELLRMLLKEAKMYLSKEIRVVPCSIYDFDFSEKLPLDVSLNPHKLVAATGIDLTDIRMVCSQLVKGKYAGWTNYLHLNKI